MLTIPVLLPQVPHRFEIDVMSVLTDTTREDPHADRIYIFVGASSPHTSVIPLVSAQVTMPPRLVASEGIGMP